MNKKEQAIEYFKCGYNCSQAVVGVFCEELGLDKDVALKLSTGFGGGLRRGEVCGAVSGAIMVIGLKYGHYLKGDTKAKALAYDITSEFENKFEKLYGSIICKKILGYDLSKEEDMKVINEKELFKKVCPDAIKHTIGILEQILYL